MKARFVAMAFGSVAFLVVGWGGFVGWGAPNPRHHRPAPVLYQGGLVDTSPKVFLVLWGSQWNGNDPSGEAAILQSFYQGALNNSAWLNTVSQYCQNVPTGTSNCSGVSGAVFASGNGTLAGVWADNGSAAPSRPTQNQIAAEAVSAAVHFGNNNNASNISTQYVILMATGNSPNGFGTQFCSFHSSVSSAVGNVAFVAIPYITDAGAACGANFNGLGPNAGITIVAGSRLADTITDPFPISGWLDSTGREVGEKCAFSSTTTNVVFSTGTFPVSPLWSNAFNLGQGGCVLSFP